MAATTAFNDIYTSLMRYEAVGCSNISMPPHYLMWMLRETRMVMRSGAAVAERSDATVLLARDE